MKKFTLLNFLVLFTFSSFSQTLINIPADFGTIQEGITAANPGDTILVSPGTYVENVIVAEKHLIIGSLLLTTGDEIYIDSTIIDGNQTGSVISFASDQHEQTQLVGFTITNGSGDESGQGGGLSLHDGSSPVLESLKITGNSAAMGGGINCRVMSSLILHNCTISNNNATDRGAGINSYNGNMFIGDCQFFDNQIVGGYGGAIYHQTGNNTFETFQVNIHNSEFSQNLIENGNTAGVSIYDIDTTSITTVNIEDCLFSENRSRSNCALAIYGATTLFNVTNCIFQDNRAGGFNAGTAFNSGCTGVVANCLYTNNIADTLGGGANGGAATAWAGSSVDFLNCSFVNNSAALGAGLTLGPGAEAVIVNCIFWGNMYNQIALLASPDLGSYAEVLHSNIQYGEDSVNIFPLSTLDWVTGNIDTDPLFEGIGDHPYSLSGGSPCIDTGLPDTSSFAFPDWDLIYNERLWDGDGNDTAVIDMGAYEFGSVPVGIKDPAGQWSVMASRSYPNPFALSTTIEYELEQAAKVNLVIFNHLGQQVDVLVSRHQLSGKHKVSFNAKGLPSGLYFSRLSVNDSSSVNKIMLIR